MKLINLSSSEFIPQRESITGIKHIQSIINPPDKYLILIKIHI